MPNLGWVGLHAVYYKEQPIKNDINIARKVKEQLINFTKDRMIQQYRNVN